MRVKGTLEYYRHIFMTEGIHEMISEITRIMREAGNEITPKRLDTFIQAVLYGTDEKGELNVRPCEPDMHDLGRGREGQDRFKFQQRVRQLYVRQRNRSV
jgi:hypothetical protein